MMLTLIAWIAFIILEQKNKPKSHEKVCKNKGFCGIAKPSENDNILEFNLYMLSNKSKQIFSNKSRLAYSLRIFIVKNLSI